MFRDQALVRLLMEKHDPEWPGYGRRRQQQRIDAVLRVWYASRAHRIDLFVSDWIKQHPEDA